MRLPTPRTLRRMFLVGPAHDFALGFPVAPAGSVPEALEAGYMCPGLAEREEDRQ